MKFFIPGYKLSLYTQLEGKTMHYRQMGKWGIRLSELSLGSWITFGSTIGLTESKELIKIAVENGINFFDTAEEYKGGGAELLLGEALKGYPREQLVVATKIFWGGGKGPNDVGLSRKHLIEGTRQSLKRLQLEYIDLLFCHRPDPHTPLEETAAAMNFLIEKGDILYWGTSEWSQEEILAICAICKEAGYALPAVEQPQYNLFHRKRVENEYLSLYTDLGIGITTWSPLDSGTLTGKYQDGIPEGSRLARNNWLTGHLLPEKLQAISQLQQIANDLSCSLAQLAIAWCLKNSYVTSVLLGVSNENQLLHNLQAISVKERLTQPIMKQIQQAAELGAAQFEYYTGRSKK
jgi:voltage-dependent potassium channel beta subunit